MSAAIGPITARDVALVRQVLQDVIAEAQRTVFEYEGKPVYEITHVELNNILATYKDEVSA